MKPWKDFFDYTLPAVPGVTQELATLHLRNAAIRLCDQAQIHEVYADPIDVAANTAEYQLEAPSTNYDICRVKTAHVQATEILPKDEVWLKENVPDWETVGGAPVYFTHLSPDAIRLVPIPQEDIAGGLTLRLVVKPSRVALGVEDFIFERYVEVIAAGAIASLAMIPNKPWSSTAVMQMYGATFQAGLRRAQAEARKNYTTVDLQVQLKRII